MGKKDTPFEPKNSPGDSRKANKTKNYVKSKSAENVAASQPVYESGVVQQDDIESKLDDGENREDQLLTGWRETRYAS